MYRSGANSNISLMPATKLSGEMILDDTKLSSAFEMSAIAFADLKQK